ncbi:hypothetical protein [Streptomyces sp. NPDC056721]|uniref:hypothetical protein n=1 Tax=unclassified Streptomyces TaxID=2593676 RepID=UPI0036436857
MYVEGQLENVACVSAYFADVPTGMIMVSSGSRLLRYDFTDEVSVLPSLSTTPPALLVPSAPAATDAARAERRSAARSRHRVGVSPADAAVSRQPRHCSGW